MSDDLDSLDACIRCGGELERGSIVGQSIFMNWLPEGEDVGLTMLGGEHLARGSVNRGPMVDAARCRSCGLGYFQGPERSD